MYFDVIIVFVVPTPVDPCTPETDYLLADLFIGDDVVHATAACGDGTTSRAARECLVDRAVSLSSCYKEIRVHIKYNRCINATLLVSEEA